MVNYKLVLNLLGLIIFAALFALTARRGATDPICGMTVERRKAITTQRGGHTYHFCSQHCQQAFSADPAEHPRRDTRAIANPPPPLDTSAAETSKREPAF